MSPRYNSVWRSLIIVWCPSKKHESTGTHQKPINDAVKLTNLLRKKSEDSPVARFLSSYRQRFLKFNTLQTVSPAYSAGFRRETCFDFRTWKRQAVAKIWDEGDQRQAIYIESFKKTYFSDELKKLEFQLGSISTQIIICCEINHLFFYDFRFSFLRLSTYPIRSYIYVLISNHMCIPANLLTMKFACDHFYISFQFKLNKLFLIFLYWKFNTSYSPFPFYLLLLNVTIIFTILFFNAINNFDFKCS